MRSVFDRLNPLVILLLLALWALILRFPTFGISVIDWDESVYLLMSEALLKGHVPYTTIWDHKPPGIYFIFTTAQLLFGSTVLSIRILSWIAVSLTAYILFKIGSLLFADPSRGYWCGLLAGLFYASYSTLNGGLAANTEIFFTPFVSYAFYSLLKIRDDDQNKSRHVTFALIASGLALGLALQIKFVVLFDVLGFLSVLLWITRSIKDETVPRVKVWQVFCFLSVLVAPSLLVVLFFWWSGHFDDYYYSNFVANGNYALSVPFSVRGLFGGIRTQAVESPLIWTALALTPWLVSTRVEASQRTRQILTIILIWLLFGGVGVATGKRFYTHYFLQILPQLCIIGSFVVIKCAEGLSSRIQTIVLFLILSSPFAQLCYKSIIVDLRLAVGADTEKMIPKDVPRLVSDYVKEKIGPDDSIYVVDEQPIIYYLSKVKPLTRYVLPVWITKREFSEFVGVDPVRELLNIFEKRPTYVILKSMKAFCRDREDLCVILKGRLLSSYTLEKTVSGVKIFRRLEIGNNPI